MSSSCKCRVCGIPCECGDMLCPLCEDEYADVYGCTGEHCKIDLDKLSKHGVDLRTLAQRIRRMREGKEQQNVTIDESG